MSYPKTGSRLLQDNADKSSGNITSTALSTNILIKVGSKAVGAIQSIMVQEQRTVSQISELGTDGIIDSAPQSSTKISGNCKRIRFDRKRIAQAFGRDFVHVQSQRKPFDIDIIDTWEGQSGKSVITTIKNVWITGISYTYSSDNWIISEDMQWQAETIYTHYSGNGNSLSNNTGDDMEYRADKGDYRGSMTTMNDYTALIDVVGQ
jgi:hypothetical protein